MSPFCCCGGSSKAYVKPNLRKEAVPKDLDAPTAGCYLVYDGDSLWIQWSISAIPEAIIFAKPAEKVPVTKYMSEASTTVLPNAPELYPLLQGVATYILQAAPYLPNFKVLPRAAEISPSPWQLVAHQPGNNVIGDRVFHARAGKGGIPTEGLDSIAAVPDNLPSFETANQTLADFKANALKEGYLVLLDPSGRKPPQAQFLE